MPFRVTIIDRQECIICCNCHTYCPEVFELSPEDGLAQIKEEFQTSTHELGEGIVPDNLEDCVKTAEELCPVEIIEVK